MKRCLLASIAASVLALAGVEVSAETPLTSADLDAIGVRLARERCKKPLSVLSKKVQNVYEPDVTDTVRVVRCPQIEISIYIARTSSPPKELLDYAMVSGPDPRVPRLMGVGATRQDVLAHLPAPTLESAETLTYVLNEEGSGQNTLKIVFFAGRVSELRWSWHLE